MNTRRWHETTDLIVTSAVALVSAPVVFAMLVRRQWLAALAWIIIADLLRRASKIGTPG